MAKKSGKPKAKKTVKIITHDEASRKNIPTAEYQSVMRKEEQSPVQVAYERRNRDLDPQLVWRGKDEKDWSDLVVHAPPLYIQEKVQPKVLIDDLMKRTTEQKKSSEEQVDLFSDLKGFPAIFLSSKSSNTGIRFTNRPDLGATEAPHSQQTLRSFTSRLTCSG